MGTRPIFLKICCAIILTSGSSPFFCELLLAEQNEIQIVQDDNVSLRSDRFEKTDVFPKDIVEKHFSSTNRPPTPAQGNTFIFIYSTVTRIENIHLVGIGGRNEKSALLFDVQGREHKRSMAFFVGLQFKDNTDIRSPYELVEGSEITMVFEVPEDTEPSELRFVYYFKKEWEDPKEQAEIPLKMSSYK